MDEMVVLCRVGSMVLGSGMSFVLLLLRSGWDTLEDVEEPSSINTQVQIFLHVIVVFCCQS